MATALLATVIVEEIVALFWKERSFRLFLLVLFVNVVTNPAINWAVYLAPDELFASNLRYYSMIFVLEACVWISEALFFWRFARMESLVRSMLFSLTLNSVSYLSGYPLDALGYWN